MISSDFRTEARRILAGKWSKAVCIVLVYLLLFFVLGFIQGSFEEGSAIYTLIRLAIYIIEVPLALGMVISFVKLYNGEEVTAFDFFKLGFNNFSKAWGIAFQTLLKMALPVFLIIVFMIILVIGTSGSVFSAAALASNSTTSTFSALALIGFIGLIASTIWATTKSYYYQLTPLIIAENPEMTAKEAVEQSANLMNGNRFKLFCLQFSFIGWAILSALTLGIGYLWLTPYTQCSIIAFYKNLSNKNVEPEATETQI